ncbi:hypothetical protein K6Y31_04765 [Motilimonas cestriensis]|uniref:Uncharacterized protein n=1 Tax=Motilimonas cestriensis TaxID=2742685 RepID=A0ABS8W580_9GAMM|nr:DUF6134 family protein [Motilimonas cestriensis]MCE2594121.1 hypothetical protein [Motilimonas cestriensis]
MGTNKYKISKLGLVTTFALTVYSQIIMAQTQSTQLAQQWNYEITLGEKLVGSMKSTFQAEQNGYRLKQQSEITTSGLWADDNIRSTLSENYQLDGTLIKSDNHLRHNDETVWTKIELSNNEYLAIHSEVTTEQQKEEAEAVEIVKQAVTTLVPNAGHVLMLGEVLLADQSNVAKNSRLGKKDFDSSFTALPYYWQQHSYSLPQKMNLFDTENMTLFSTNIQFIGTETQSINQTTIETQHYRLNITDSAPIDIWLAGIKPHLSYFVQIAGREDGESYTVKLKGLE